MLKIKFCINTNVQAEERGENLSLTPYPLFRLSTGYRALDTSQATENPRRNTSNNAFNKLTLVIMKKCKICEWYCSYA